MQRFTAQWVEVKILNVNALPHRGENEEDHPCMSLHRKEILQLMHVLRFEKSFQYKAVQRQVLYKEKGTQGFIVLQYLLCKRYLHGKERIQILLRIKRTG